MPARQVPGPVRTPPTGALGAIGAIGAIGARSHAAVGTFAARASGILHATDARNGGDGMLNIGDPAVDFHLPATTGEIALSDLKGRPFLLSFFTMAFTPV